MSVVDKDSVGITGPYNSIAIDTSGKPHISYYNYHSGDLWYARWNGRPGTKRRWTTRIRLDITASMALDSLNHPHICYSD